MIAIARSLKFGAALSAIGVNVVLAAGLASLAHHYEARAAQERQVSVAAEPARSSAQAAAIATAQCRPERVARS